MPEHIEFAITAFVFAIITVVIGLARVIKFNNLRDGMQFFAAALAEVIIGLMLLGVA
jgi:hypothetical protein